jgi:hypothetical protein
VQDSSIIEPSWLFLYSIQVVLQSYASISARLLFPYLFVVNLFK